MSKLYAFSIIFIVLVGFAAYFLGKFVPRTGDLTMAAIDNSKTANKIIEEYGGARKVYPDSLANFPNTSVYSSYTAPASNPASALTPTPGQTQTTAPAQVPAQTPISEVILETKSVEDVTESVPLSDIPVVTSLGEDFEIYKSRLNRKVTFSIPTGSKVEETGMATNLKFVIVSPNTKKYTMMYTKVSSGCYDPLGSFSIASGQGIDFRIIQGNKEGKLENSLNALQLHEMYGSYEGTVGFRGNACIQTAVPTKVEIRASGYGRYEGDEAYKLFDKIINSLTV